LVGSFMVGDVDDAILSHQKAEALETGESK